MGRLLPDEPRRDRVDHAATSSSATSCGRATSRAGGKAFDLREIKAPIILFASMGDNITPPQQAFNWVADVYGSTEEIKARGQVIVGLMHQDVGPPRHLRVRQGGEEGACADRLGAEVDRVAAAGPVRHGRSPSSKGADGKAEYEVEFREHRLEDIAARLNRFERADEKPFEAVAAVSEFNQRAYELFAQPLVQAMSNELRAQAAARSSIRCASSAGRSPTSIPWLAWLAPAAQAVKAQPPARSATTHPLRKRREGCVAELISASLDYYRAMRDAASEAAFFPIYGNMFSLYLARQAARPSARRAPAVRAARAAVRQGGAGVDRAGRLRRGARARRLPAGAQGRAAAAVAARPCARSWPKTMRDYLPRHGAGRVAPHPRRAGDHRALRARAGARDPAAPARRAAPTANGC